MKKGFVIGLVCIIVFSASLAAAGRGEYPTKPIQMVVPYTAGGGTDVFARNVIRYSDLADKIVVRNIAGGGARIGTMEVINSNPDGYTLLAHLMALSIGYHAGLYDTPPWMDLVPICAITVEDNAISVKADSPWETIDDLIQHAKDNPGELRYGFAGVGGTTHTLSAIFVNRTGIEVNFAPFAGGADSRTALAGGHIDAISSQVSEVYDMVEAGDLRILVTTGTERHYLTPNVPTMLEHDIDFVFQVWRGFFAPKGTDSAIIQRIADSFEETTKNKEFIKIMSNLGFQIEFKGPEALLRQMEKEHADFSEISDLLKADA